MMPLKGVSTCLLAWSQWTLHALHCKSVCPSGVHTCAGLEGGGAAYTKVQGSYDPAKQTARVPTLAHLKLSPSRAG